MTRPRLTIRRLMIAVAIVGVLTSLELWLASRQDRFNELAAIHRRESVRFPNPEFGLSDPFPEGHPLGRGAHYQRKKAFENYHNEMAEKYSSAASSPWLPVNPDPPEPERTASYQMGESWTGKPSPVASLPFRLIPEAH